MFCICLVAQKTEEKGKKILYESHVFNPHVALRCRFSMLTS
jgi:hypothetical protein